MGDIVKIVDNEILPADLIVINTCLEGGNCFIETSSLDGEKNLKPKGALNETLIWFNKEIIN
jgi:P-type E1-E2 ATPase